MPKVTVYNVEGQTVGEMELSDAVFGAEVNESLLHDAVVRHLANQRQGTADTKTRSEVAGGGRKPWRQKGTGRARQGSTRSPQWRHGGVVFGPHPRDFRLQMPRRSRRAALRSALSAKVAAGDLVILDQLSFAEPKTKAVTGIIGKLQLGETKTLIVTAGPDANVYKSARNLPRVGTSQAGSLNVYDVMVHGKLVMTRDAALKVEEVLA
ncbi:MAG: 50S ribosomal protein L4 [Firmicutes bacterium]|nr:50S ribosomal protein L4 [Bacillota bacterium]